MIKYFTKHWIQGIFALSLFFSVMGIGFNILGTGAKMVNNGIDTAYNEFKPEAMLRKYEWFKDAAGQLTAKRNNLTVLSAKIKPLRAMKRKDMDRQDKQDLALWESELAGLAMSYNNLVAEYNSQLSKFNWKPFKGDLPIGAEQVLNENYALYTTGEQ